MVSVFNQSLRQREKVKEDAFDQLFGRLLVLNKEYNNWKGNK
jgi:hypothetical protein